jgi:DNA-binding NtrC family response regulator
MPDREQTMGMPRILVVDDESDMCWAFENILRPAGYAVTTAITSAQALEFLATDNYAAAFLDAKLPDIDGLKLAALVRERSPQTAIVLMSGYFYPEDKAIAKGLQQNLLAGFISKPFRLEEVRGMARRATRQTQADDTGEERQSTRP